MSDAPVDSWGRALAAAAVLGDASGAVARLGGAPGDRARATLAGWGALASGDRVRAVAAAAAAVRAAVPAGATRVDRSWIEAALGDDPRGRDAWERRLGGEVGVWWSRTVTAGWVALPAEDDAVEVAVPGDLARWSAARLVGAMRRVGLAILVHVTIEAGDAAIARLAAAVVDGGEVVDLARRLREERAVRDGLGPVRAAIGRVRGVDPATDVGLGAATLAGHLAGDAGIQVRLLVPVDVARAMDGDGLEVGWEAIRRLVARRP